MFFRSTNRCSSKGINSVWKKIKCVCCDSGGHHAWSWTCSSTSVMAPDCWTCWRWWAASASWVPSQFTTFSNRWPTVWWTDSPTLWLCFAESGERPGNVSAQEQHWEGPLLSKEEIGKLYALWLSDTECSIIIFTGNYKIVQFLQGFVFPL